MGRNEERRATSLPTSKLTSNIYPINEKLEALIIKTDNEIRRDASIKRTFILSALALVLLICLVIFGIVSVAHAQPIKEKVWPSQESPFQKKNKP